MTKFRNVRKGISLIEALVAMLVLAVGITGGSYLFVFGRGQIRLRNEYRVAVRLASESLEKLKATAYTDIAVGTDVNDIMVDSRTYTRKVTTTNDLGGYKQAGVTVSWQILPSSKQFDVSLVTLIAP